MEILESVYTVATVGLLVFLFLGLFVVRIITPVERRLVTSVGVLLAGVFFIAHPHMAGSAEVVGTVLWVLGLGTFLDNAFGWRSDSASRIGPVAVLFLLPPAFLGTVMIGGVIVGVLG